METTTTYSSIEKIIYKFSEWDIQEALIKANKINIANKKVLFEMFEGCTLGQSYVLLTVSYETVKKENNEK